MHGYVYKSTPAPPELYLAFEWRDYGTPYAAGGLRDQPLRFLHRARACMGVYNVLSAWKNKPNYDNAQMEAQWMKDNKNLINAAREYIKIAET